MARQLRAQGQDVALLAIIDMSLPNYLEGSIRGKLYHHERRLRRLGLLGYFRKRIWTRIIRKRIWRGTKKMFRRVAYRKVRKGTRRIVHIVRRVACKSSLVFGHPPPHAPRNTYLLNQREGGGPNSKEQQALKPKRRGPNSKAQSPWKRRRQALNSYDAQAYSGRITLFRTAGFKYYWTLRGEPCRGWDRVAAGGVEVHEVPGGHHTLMKEPHI